MKHCPKCKNLMPDDVSRCVRCGHDSSIDLPPVETSAATSQSIEQKPISKLRSVNWLRVCAVAFTSKLFFLASCTAGMVAPALFEDSDDYGPAITESRPPPTFVTVIATIPDPQEEGQRKAVVEFLSRLDEFKAKNPGYSFLLSPGKGQVDNPAAEMLTTYSVTSSGPGKVIVKSYFRHEAPFGGLDVHQRYEATDKSIRLLNARGGAVWGARFVLGLIFATVLAITGKILRWRLRLTEPPASAADLAAAKTAATKRTLKILAVAIGIALLFSALAIFFSS